MLKVKLIVVILPRSSEAESTAILPGLACPELVERMTASGSKERVEKGKNILIWATLGLIIIFSAYTVVYFVLKEVLGKAGAP